MLVLRLKALADDTRIGIIRFLFKGKKTVSEITASTGKSQPNASLALKQLMMANLIFQEKKGKFIYYGLKNKEDLREIFKILEKNK